MKAPFPYFGGKSKIAPKIWAALGNPKHYIEPFFGSGAVLLARPEFDPSQMTETVCDKDGFLANVWRGLQSAPDEVAKYCDWPVNHADLSARKKELLKNKERLLENLIVDPEWFDAKLAGYWIWAASCWIGSGLTRPGSISRLSGHSGAGVHAINQRPHLTSSQGVHAIGKRPHLASRSGGIGVHALSQRADFKEPEKDVREPYSTSLYSWFRQLSERLRYVRVVCGDWTRVCGGNWQNCMGTVGIFFDPPYAVKDRDDVYDTDSFEVADDVREWALERGKLPDYRIVITGYDEHAELLKHGWKGEAWETQGGYSNISSKKNANCKREMIYYSPNCVEKDRKLFEE